MHYYQHNIGDYRRDTIHLSLLEHGIYRQLLDYYYLNEEPLPLDIEKICRSVCARNPEETQSVILVISEFFKKTENGYIHTRCDLEINNYQHRVDVARENGKRGGRPIGTTKKTQSVILANPELTQKKANQEPITNNQEPLKPKTSSASGDAGDGEKSVQYSKAFLMFWDLYPHKVNKGAAYKSFKRIKQAEYQSIREGLERKKTCEQWRRDNGKFIPHASTWLNARGWEDGVPDGESPDYDQQSFLRRIGAIP